MSKESEVAQEVELGRNHAPARDEVIEHVVMDDHDGTSEVLLDISHMKGDAAANLQVAKDGHTVLVPQPTADPEDPLNWSSFKKHMVLITVGLLAFNADFSGASVGACVLVQGKEWGMTPNHVNYAGNLNVVMLGVGSLLWMPFIYFWGRAPVLFWTCLLGTAFQIASAAAPDFTSWYAFRGLHGLFITSGVATGLTIVKDMFYFHEHARKIGIWASMFLLAPYLGGGLANFMVGGLGEWRPVMWLCAAQMLLTVVFMILFMDETYYDRSIPQELQPPRGTRLTRLFGIWQIRHHDYFWTLGSSFLRMAKVIIKPIVLLIMIYYGLSFMWAVGINQTSAILLQTPRSEKGYGFGATSTGYVYFAPIVAVVIGEAFGHYFNDFLARRYVRKHAGIFRPEARLWTNYIGSVLMVPGLVIVGLAVQFRWSVAAVVIGWGTYVLGVMMASVAIMAYALDSYPQASGELCALINVARLFPGFAVGYFQQPWGEKNGYGVSFGIQAATILFATSLLLVLHKWGHALRTMGGGLHL